MAVSFLPHVKTLIDGIDTSTDIISYNLIKNRIIFINGEITSEVALSTINQLKFLNDKSNMDVYLVINSPGGSVYDGLLIYDYINRMECDINTIASGLAASMGAFLLACGTKGKRYATISSEIMIHQPLGGVQGQATDISLLADHMHKVKMKLAEIMAKHCNKKIENVIFDMERDFWMTAEEAKKYGLIDHVGYPELF